MHPLQLVGRLFLMSIPLLKRMSFLWKVLLHLIMIGLLIYGKRKKGKNHIPSTLNLLFLSRNENGLYRRFDEVHTNEHFLFMIMSRCLWIAGFSMERIFADWEDEPPHDESERIFFQVTKITFSFEWYNHI